MRFSLVLAAVASIALSAGCSGDEPDEGAPIDDPAEVAAPKLRVRTTSFPAHWLVARLAGDRVEAINILPEGEDPPDWRPPGEVVASLVDVDLIVANGAGFEAWMATATLPESRVVLSADGVDLIEVESTTHSHGADGQHSHEGIDPHTWSDPTIYVQQAEAIRAALAKADPARADAYSAAFSTLKGELEVLDADLARALEPLKGTKLAASHPAFNYLGRRYDLDIHSFDFDPETAPSAEQLEEFAAWAEGIDAPLLLWEARPDAVTGAFPPSVRHVHIDPLEQPASGSYDYLLQAQNNLEIFAGLTSPAEEKGTP
jgi:zinc transport system substrate-binding protein